jgi:hypothetical protein
MQHWLRRAKRAMHTAGYGYLWLPGCTAWAHFMPDMIDDHRAVREAQRRGWLTRGTGFAQLTQRGYQEI